MTKENLINLVNNKKPVELVQELKDCEIKKSHLSPAARSKVINKSGGGYISENKERYGPCSSSNCTCSKRFRFGYEAINYLFGSPVVYSRIYESAEALRNDISNIQTKQGYWATVWVGPFVNNRITDWQASEGCRYAKFALEQYDKGYSVNLKSWSISHSGGSQESDNQYMGDSWNWKF